MLFYAWLGVQAPTAEVRVVLEVPFDVDKVCAQFSTPMQ